MDGYRRSGVSLLPGPSAGVFVVALSLSLPLSPCAVPHDGIGVPGIIICHSRFRSLSGLQGRFIMTEIWV
jgi:hypothetical protein